MNLITAKSLDQIKLTGIRFAWEKTDGMVRSITLTDEAGNRATFTKANEYSAAVSVLIPEPPKMEDRWVLQGEFAGVKINQAFTTERDADRAKNDFPGDALEIIKTTVAVDSDGKPAETVDSDIPF